MRPTQHSLEPSLSGRDTPVCSLGRALTDTGWFSDVGPVLSWRGGSGGYPYEEATALLGRLFRWTGNAAGERRCTEVLESILQERSMLGRDGLGYAFDSGLALPLLREPEPLAERVLGLMESGMASTSVTRPGWWSQSFGCHLLRSLAAVRRLGFERRVDALLEELVEQTFDGERFRTRAGSPATYVHAHCYAVEGLLIMEERLDVALAGARWLARIQQLDGSFPDWVGRPESLRPTDSVAQALRIWLLLDRVEFQRAIESAERYLRRCQARSGAMLYTPERSDECSWASIFSLQALTWASEGLPSGAAQELV